MYIVTCLYGLERILAEEVAERLGAQAERHWSEVVFAFDGAPARLAQLRVANNVFLLLDSFRIGHTRPDLQTLASRLTQIPFARWQQCWRALTGERPPQPDISVKVVRKGKHNFTYVEVEELALDTVSSATGEKTTLEPRPLELRIEIHEQECRLSGRLSPVALSRRPYLRRRIPAATDPTLAAAMVRMSRPKDGDVFLDPFCGSGTIPLERALCGPAKLIAAGDVKARHMEWVEVNARHAAADVLLGQWDTLALPFADGSFTCIVTNPPQGNPSTGKPWRRVELEELLAEPLRVLEYGGRMVWLTCRARALMNAAKRVVGLKVRRQLRCNWKGRPWTVHLIEKAL